MINKIKVEHTVYLTKKLGTGPFQTVVYSGRYGVLPDTNSPKNSDQSGKMNLSSDVLVKKIDARIVKDDVNWKLLQKLDHPFVARYTLVYLRRSIFLPDTIYIIQGHYPLTLADFIDNLAKLTDLQVIKRAVLHMAQGLNYLHDQGIAHGNLKPTNILIKPPLHSPPIFILTDYSYTSMRQCPQVKSFSCFKSAVAPAEIPRIDEWKSPEEKEESVLFDGENVSRTKVSAGTPKSDMYSFGLILKLLVWKIRKLDTLDGILAGLLVIQMMFINPDNRISCREIVETHPFLIVQPDGCPLSEAEARIDYIKFMYDRYKMETKETQNLRQGIEASVLRVFGKYTPWNAPANTFRERIWVEMEKRARTEYDVTSFLDLLRLIRNLREHPIGKKFKVLHGEIARDTLSQTFPCVLPLVYITLQCPHSAKVLIGQLSDVLHKHAQLGNQPKKKNWKKNNNRRNHKFSFEDYDIY